jgi:hypothetical protein
MLSALLLIGILSTAALAQTDADLTYPPPVRLASKAEQEKLATAKSIKDRTRLALEMMETRLASAERFATATDFDSLYRELGFFEGVLDDQLDYMIRTDNDSGRSLDNFKRLEIGLRGFTTRIESIRRELPLRYEPFVRSVGRTVRDARSRALEPLFSDTVLPEAKRP